MGEYLAQGGIFLSPAQEKGQARRLYFWISQLFDDTLEPVLIANTELRFAAY
jgi:hypothetical protein